MRTLIVIVAVVAVVVVVAVVIVAAIVIMAVNIIMMERKVAIRRNLIALNVVTTTTTAIIITITIPDLGRMHMNVNHIIKNTQIKKKRKKIGELRNVPLKNASKFFVDFHFFNLFIFYCISLLCCT